MDSYKRADFQFFEVLEEFIKDIEELMSIDFYSVGNRGVKEGQVPQEMRNRELLGPSL